MVVETELYDTLGISPTASSSEIKKAFRKLALKHHPDKGGDSEKFKKINGAYEILKDEEKRRNYDQYGKDGLKGQLDDETMSSLFGDLFGQRFGGNMFNNAFKMFNVAKEVITKTPQVVHVISVSLEDVCTEKTKRLKFPRERVCECVNDNPPKTCPDCKGQGVKIMQQKMRGMIIMNQIRCSCAKGKIYNSCTKCKNGIYIDEKIFSFKLSPKVVHDSQKIFKNQGNQQHELEIGDFIVIIKIKKHPIFKFDELGNLHINKQIPLKNALCGGQFNITHPNGKLLTIKYNDIIPNSIRKYKHGITENSDLIVFYSIEFPELSIKQKNKLKNIL